MAIPFQKLSWVQQKCNKYYEKGNKDKINELFINSTCYGSEESSQVDEMQFMIDRGANPRIDNDLVFAKHGAPTIDIYKLLSSYGADINAHNSSALDNAISMGKNDCVEYLLQKDSNVTENIVKNAVNWNNTIAMDLLHKYQPNNEFVKRSNEFVKRSGEIILEVFKEQHQCAIYPLKLMRKFGVDINVVIDNM